MGTDIGPIARIVRCLVILQGVWSPEFFAADVTFVRSLICVQFRVIPQSWSVIEGFSTGSTRKGFSPVCIRMCCFRYDKQLNVLLHIRHVWLSFLASSPSDLTLELSPEAFDTSVQKSLLPCCCSDRAWSASSTDGSQETSFHNCYSQTFSL